MRPPLPFVAFAVAVATFALAAGQASPLTGVHVEGGQGEFRFRWRPELLKLPEGATPMNNGHGLVKDSDGRIYFTYEPVAVKEDTRALVRFNPDGTGGELLGPDNTLAFGVPHGLRISYEEAGAFLYHANNGHVVHKTDLEGNLVWSNNVTAAWAGTPFWPCLPTDAVVPPGSASVYVADGYGSSFVHLLDVATGAYQGVSFGGLGSSTSPQRFSCPHGINFDQEIGLLVVSDRANARLQYVRLDGTHAAGVDMSEGAPAGAAGHMPDNVDLQGAPANQGPLGSRNLLVPSLDGTVAVLDSSMAVLSILNISALLGPACPHPHDAIFLDSGDMVLCCWAPGHLSYWERLPAAPVQ